MLRIKLKKLFNFDHRHFVLTIGDKGAILTLFQQKRLVKRIFALNPTEEQVAPLINALTQYKTAPISILVDVLDQSYTRQSLPAVGALSIHKLVKHRLARDYAATDLTGALSLGRSTSGRKDWNYIFISLPMVPPIADWMELIYKLPNRCTGIYLLPVEISPIIQFLGKDIVKTLNRFTLNKITKSQTPKDKNAAKDGVWRFFVAHNKVCGFRQVVTYKDQIIFTHLITSQDTLPDLVAGNIEQEISNTVEYLKRLSLKEDAELEITIAVAEELKQRIDPKRLPSEQVNIYTPYELATKLKMPYATEESDKFTDTLIASSFMRQQRPVLRLLTKPLKQANAYFFTQRAAITIATIALPLFIIYTALTGLSIFNTNQDILLHEQKVHKLKQDWEKESQALGEYDLESASKINDVATLYRLLSNNEFSPLTFLADFNTIKGEEVIVNSVEWALTENKAITQSANGEATPQEASTTVTASLDVVFNNMGNSFEVLFESFDGFISQLEHKFSNYKVDYSRLPSKINFEEKNKAIPIKINITGPVQKPKEEAS